MEQQQHQEDPPQRSQHDICHSDAQCLNGGTCVGGNTFGTFTTCDCREPYNGERCETHCPLDCRNQGICVTTDQQQQYHCKCFGLFTGSLCTVPYVNCNRGVRCYNGGICVAAQSDDNENIQCQCPNGYKGATCRQPIVAETTGASSALDQVLTSLHNNSLPLSVMVACFGLLFGVMAFSRLRRQKRTMEHRYTGVELQPSSRTNLRNIV